MTRDFNPLLQAKWNEGKFLCVGLDSEFERIPVSVNAGTKKTKIVRFNSGIVDATKHIVCAYKPNIAFYEAYGSAGLDALFETVHYIHEVAPRIPVILDCKRGDIGKTNEGYVKMAFD